MEHIDKSKYRKEFDAYTLCYLHDAKMQDGCFYPKLESKESFGAFSANKYKNTSVPVGTQFDGWLSLLLHEQNGRCCYCMRKLKPNEISVEHLVPESFNGLDENEEYRFYAGLTEEIRDYVVTGSVFDQMAMESIINLEQLKRMPHLIAHSNLFPACSVNSLGCSCNNHRGNHRILPMMLMGETEKWLDYSTDGELRIFFPDVDISRSTLRYLDINCKTLREIRHLWFLFSRKQLHPENENLSIREKDSLLRTVLDLDAEIVIPLDYQKYLLKPTYWNLLLQYDWFFFYYLHKQQ